jgi:hypothetical protein
VTAAILARIAGMKEKAPIRRMLPTSPSETGKLKIFSATTWLPGSGEGFNIAYRVSVEKTGSGLEAEHGMSQSQTLLSGPWL